MEDMRDKERVPVFKLANILSLYKKRMQQLGLRVDKRIHSTRLKNILLAALPNLTAHVQSREVLLSFKDDIGIASIKACDHDIDAVYLV